MPAFLRFRIVPICLALLLVGTLAMPRFQGYIVFIFLNGLVAVNATLLYAKLTLSRRFVDMVLGVFVLFLTQITVTQLYAGLAGYAFLPVVALLQIACLAATLIAIKIGCLRGPSLASCRTTAQSLTETLAHGLTETRFVIFAVAGTVLVFVFVFAVSALNPPVSIDSIFFHLNRPVEWLQTGEIPFRLMTSYSYPHGIGLITLWFLFPFHHDFIARLSQTPMILIGALACYGIARQIGLTRPLALMTACVVLTTPAYLSGGIALTDPDTQLAATFLTSTYFVVSLIRQYRAGTVILLGLSLGLLLSSKYNAVYYGVPLVLMVIYAWVKGLQGERTLPVWKFVAHGFALVFLPLAVGGVTYLYDLYMDGTLHPFKYMTPGNKQFVQTFRVSLFLLSPASLIQTGLTGIVGCLSIVGFMLCIWRRDTRTILLPLFLVLPILFSVGVYYTFGYYEGPLAIRHLLGTVALGVVLAAWAISLSNEHGQRIGLPFLGVLLVVNIGLGFYRQWPLHLPHTNLLATLGGLGCGLTVLWLLTHRYRHDVFPGSLSTAASFTTLRLLAVLMVLWGLGVWEWAYRDLKYARWTPFFG
ncbi:MAG: glycosyltransferase family 39 protein, partial [candidate division Zixibacteria bacterium]|nr:glycosyltransferase family 39 protein [candidate division Zixibacteria bacterium]